MACLGYIKGQSTDDLEILEIQREIRGITMRCERDFNGMFQLRFLEEDGGVLDQKCDEWERTHLIITLLNKAIGEDRNRKSKKKRRKK